MRRSSEAFTLIEVILVLAVMAILAGVMAPHAVREIEASRREAALRELGAVEDGLLAHYRDCGQLPATATGLAALVRNAEGHPSWNGPYVGGSGDVEAGILSDAWGEAYVYVRDPDIVGAAADADFLVLSGGKDRNLDSVEKSGRWTLDSQNDLVLQGVTRAIDETWEARTEEKLSAIEDGLQLYYLDVGGFPAGTDSAALGELVSSTAAGWNGPYVRDTRAAIARDPWGSQIILRPCMEVDGEGVDGWLLLSYGSGQPDARVKGQKWQIAVNDIHRIVGADQLEVSLDRRRAEEARREMTLVMAEILVTHPQASPDSGPLASLDPWGRAYQYLRKSDIAGVLYSRGANGVDEAGTGDDLYEPLVWPLPDPS